MSRYNGWKNWETWAVNLWFGDSWGEIKDPDVLEEIVRKNIENEIGDKSGSFLGDIIEKGFLCEVDWQELADANDGPEEEEEVESV